MDDDVHSWSTNAVVTDSDKSYESGTPAAVQYYQRRKAANVGARRVYATMGNHDWQTGNDTASTSYFGRPSNYVAHLAGGLIDLFVADTHNADPDRSSVNSQRAKKFYSSLARRTAQGKPMPTPKSQ